MTILKFTIIFKSKSDVNTKHIYNTLSCVSVLIQFLPKLRNTYMILNYFVLF